MCAILFNYSVEDLGQIVQYPFNDFVVLSTTLDWLSTTVSEVHQNYAINICNGFQLIGSEVVTSFQKKTRRCVFFGILYYSVVHRMDICVFLWEFVMCFMAFCNFGF